MQAEEDNKPAQTVVEEGEQVTGGGGAARPETQETKPTVAPAGDAERTPDHDTKKEDMTSYNEHPDQEKVGGG
jgi:hypothetical protein